ncbi:MAG: nucleotidyltransferase domain-containing protein [Betaproteobacteria bacterium]
MGYRLRTSDSRKSELDSALRAFLSRVAETDVRLVILFGSLARGDVGPDSDLDLVVIRDSAEPFLRRGEDLLRLLPPGTPVDLLVYTPEEWQNLIASNSFFKAVQEEGIVVYEA